MKEENGFLSFMFLIVARHTEIGANGKQFFHYNAEQTAQSASMQHVFIGEAA